MANIMNIKTPESIEEQDIMLDDKPVIIVKRGYNDDSTQVELLDKALEAGVVVLVIPRNAEVERMF